MAWGSGIVVRFASTPEATVCFATNYTHTSSTTTIDMRMITMPLNIISRSAILATPSTCIMAMPMIRSITDSALALINLVDRSSVER